MGKFPCVGRTAQSEEGVPARPGGGETNPVCPPGDWPVSGGSGPEHRYCGIHHRQQLLRQVRRWNILYSSLSPLVIGQFLEAGDQNTGIVGSTTGSNYYVRWGGETYYTGVCPPSCDWPVSGSRGPEHRYCGINHRQQLLCEVRRWNILYRSLSSLLWLASFWRQWTRTPAWWNQLRGSNYRSTVPVLAALITGSTA
jgi:hypothetical protein